VLQPTQCLKFSSTENLTVEIQYSCECNLSPIPAITHTDDTTTDPLSLDASKRVDELGPKAVVIDVEIVM